MKSLAALLGIVFISWSAAVASEEEILTPRKVTITEDGSKVTITADGRKDFGEVSAAIERTKEANEYRIKSITLTVSGKTFVVPKEQFADLSDPLIKTAEFRSEAGRGGPWLYLTFQLEKQGAKSASDRPRVYIRYQNGKLMERSIRQPPK